MSVLLFFWAFCCLLNCGCEHDEKQWQVYWWGACGFVLLGLLSRLTPLR